MPVVAPGPGSRWRCGSCGNLTRFDVVRTVRSREFVHVSLAGEPQVQDRDVLSEAIESVTCRWCAAVNSVIVEDRPDVIVEDRPDVIVEDRPADGGA